MITRLWRGWTRPENADADGGQRRDSSIASRSQRMSAPG